MYQEIITGIIIFIAIVYAIVMIYNSLTKAKNSGNICSGGCSGCKIDMSKIRNVK